MAYFANNRRGEIPELQEELNSIKPEKKREAIKKVIAAMTVGKDVSALFPHVVKCIDTNNVEIKKLVYLYIINYAKSQPDLAIMAVNSFRKDARNPISPLIRALAVRTMGCIRVDRITEYLCEPLKDCLTDEDPYVRKTAAICVAKLYDIAPELVEDSEFFGVLARGLSDGNALVLSNTVAAISEISQMRGDLIIPIDFQVVNKMLSALNECTEWGQVFILDFLTSYTPADSKEAESIMERVTPRLAHANPAVVTSAVKVIIKNLDLVTSPESIRNYYKKLAPSLVTLLNSDAEIQYIALRCINLIVQKRPTILEKEIRVFFCKYNDPVYVKLEKLEIIIRLADHRNIESILQQLKDYATEIDVDFVKKSIQAIGLCAIKLERSVDRCVQTLSELVALNKNDTRQERANYHVQEILIAMREIFRKYPNRFELMIRDIFETVEDLDDPEAKSAFVWILGEYSDKIDDSVYQLRMLAESFKEEPLKVQLQLLTAAVKVFLKKPEEGEPIITEMLRVATEECPNPDLRDRAYIYWRLLSTDPEATKAVVMCEKPAISDASYTFDSVLLDRLIEQLGTLSSVYHKPYHTKVSKVKAVEKEEAAKEENERDLVQPDLFNMDFLGLEQPASSRAQIPMQVVLTNQMPGVSASTGLQIEMAFQRKNEAVLEAKFTNNTQSVLQDFAMQFNNNPFGLLPSEALAIEQLAVGESKNVTVKIAFNGSRTAEPPGVPFIVQMAVKCSLDVFYFQTPCMLTVLLEERGPLSKEEYKETWQAFDDSQEFYQELSAVHPDFNQKEALKNRLVNNYVFFVAERQKTETSEDVLYFNSTICTGEAALAEITASTPISSARISVRTSSSSLAALFIQAVNFLLSSNS